MKATLLVELLTEELPPKSLRALSEAFGGSCRRSGKGAAEAARFPREAGFRDPSSPGDFHTGGRVACRRSRNGGHRPVRVRPSAGRGRLREEARGQRGITRAPRGRQGRGLCGAGEDRRPAARRGSRPARRGGAQVAPDPQADALGQRRHAVRPAGARPGDAARRARDAGHGARPFVLEPHQWPPLHGQGRARHRECRGL